MCSIQQMNKVIAIHGNSSSSNAFVKIDNCTKVINLPGHGGTPLQEEFSIPNIVKFLAKEIGDEEVIIIAHSLGANMIFQMLDQLNIKALISFGAPPLNDESMDQAFLQTPELGLFFTADLSEQQMKEMAQVQTCQKDNITHIFTDIKSTNPKIRTDIAASLQRGELKDEVSALIHASFPILFIHGTEDNIVNGSYIRELGIGEFIEIPGGHALSLDNPQGLNNCISNFINNV